MVGVAFEQEGDEAALLAAALLPAQKYLPNCRIEFWRDLATSFCLQLFIIG